MKQLFILLFGCIFFLSVYDQSLQAALSEGEKSEIVSAVLSGDYSVLDKLSVSEEVNSNAYDVRLACTPGCHATGSNPFAEAACAAQFTPSACMSLYERIGCLWVCR